jgi:hypothetical protein
MCNISGGTNLSELIEKATLILSNEAPMTRRRCFEAVDRSIRDILFVNDSSLGSLPFGGKSIVLGGDFSLFLRFPASVYLLTIFCAFCWNCFAPSDP